MVKPLNLDIFCSLSEKRCSLSVQVSSVAQLCPTLCDPMNRSTPGLLVHHQLLEFTQTHVHQVGDAIQPSHPLLFPSPPAPNPQNTGKTIAIYKKYIKTIAIYKHILFNQFKVFSTIFPLCHVFVYFKVATSSWKTSHSCMKSHYNLKLVLGKHYRYRYKLNHKQNSRYIKLIN